MGPRNFFCLMCVFLFSARDMFDGCAVKGGGEVERGKKGKCQENLETYGHMT